MSKERMEEIRKRTWIHVHIGKDTTAEMPRDDMEYLHSQAKRVQELENRNKELEYASKYNGELNEFLQKRNLPPNTLGRHVIDVVMDYVQELEHGKEHLELIKERQEDEYRNVYEQNKRYRETLEKILINQTKTPAKLGKTSEIARQALEESE